jgi:inhibitor of KinA sporulation pathway (predicted exonuclease)
LAGKLDQLIVIDVESTCWDDIPPEGEEAEIIEIGVCVLDIASGHPLAKQSILIKPERSRVSPFCTALTTLTQAQVEGGVTFERGCAILKRKYCSRNRIWASYGDYDRRQFEKQCQERRIDYPFGPSHINIKSLFAILHALPREVGMLEALELMHLPTVGTHHRGIDDAWNTAVLLSTLLLQRRMVLKRSDER